MNAGLCVFRHRFTHNLAGVEHKVVLGSSEELVFKLMTPKSDIKMEFSVGFYYTVVCSCWDVEKFLGR